MGRKKKYAAEAESGEGVENAEEAKAVRAPKGAKGKEDQASGDSLMGKIQQFREFFEQSKVEIKKVTWPTRKETISTGIAVLVLTLVMAVYLGVVDVALSKLVELILS
jgi:preprotein translocase subunit SecE